MPRASAFWRIFSKWCSRKHSGSPVKARDPNAARRNQHGPVRDPLADELSSLFGDTHDFAFDARPLAFAYSIHLLQNSGHRNNGRT
jgi:hypothetical protein